MQFTQAAVEVVTGLRPPAQLMGWTSDDVRDALQRRHALALRPGARPRRYRVRSVHVSTPVEGVAEVAAVVEDGARYRAVAFRMEGRERRWLVTAIDFG
ncbi:MAG: Rv3235 family protein [Kineosporiaceae bacterium]